jgi:hypothetical protein
MPSYLVHTTETWECGRTKHRCSKPENLHRLCATRLVLRTCAMHPVVASKPLVLLARSTVYGRTRILKRNFELVLKTRTRSSTDLCATSASTCWRPQAHRRNSTSLFRLSLLLDFLFPFSRTFPATAKNRLDSFLFL